MAVRVEFTNATACLLAHVDGSFTVDEIVNVIELTKKRAESLNLYQILLDAKGLDCPANDADRVAIGKALAKFFPPPYRISILFTEEYINYVMAYVANELGSIVNIHHDQETAIHWLIDVEGSFNVR